MNAPLAPTPGDAPGFSVLLAQRGARDVMALARALATARRTPVQDQVLAARSSWGIVAEKLGEPVARVLVQALLAGGVEAFACPASAVAELPEAEPATTIAALPTASPPVLVAIAATITTVTKTVSVKEGPTKAEKAISTAIKLTTMIPVNIGGRGRTVQKTEQPTDLVFHADLVYREPWRRVRIAASQFDYSVLKERMLFHAQGNIKLLAGDLVAAAPGAWLNHGAAILLEGKPMQQMGYGSLADLEREERWLLTLQQRGA